MWVINLLGIALIATIVWWFWLYKPEKAVVAGDSLQVVVENGTYQPSRVQLLANQPAKLHFLRKDASPCAATVVFQGLDISAELPLDQDYVIELPPLGEGRYAFTCQMQMYRGEIVVSDHG